MRFFKKIITEQIHHIPDVLNISDDVIVNSYDESLHAVFRKFAEVNLTLNKSKCKFNKSTLTFFGFVFPNKGIAPDPKAINNASPPTSTSAVRSFLLWQYIVPIYPKLQ